MRAEFTHVYRLAATVALLLGCGSDGVELRVDVRTDWVPVAEFAEIEVSIDGTSETVIYDAGFDDDFLTGIRVASLEDVKPGTVSVRARILAADGRRLVQRVVTAEVTGPTTLTLVFTRSCAAVTCPDGAPSATECVGGRCVGPECSPENPEACGAGGCEVDDDCGEAPVGCARTICTAGECFVGSDFSACATGEFCHPELGCQPRPVESDAGTSMDGGTMSMEDGGTGPTDMGPPEECGMACDTGNACEVGTYDCSSGEPICVRDSLVSAGTVCRETAGECDVAESCDGSSPTCPMDGFEATGTSCSAGFCDGLGTCSDSCTPGASCSTGNPCETGSIDCSGGTPSCTRSGNAPNGTSCGTTENGPFGSCGGFSSTCDETGTRTRTITTYECQSGSCESSSEGDIDSCSRSTTGSSCGSTMTTSWSACSGFSGTCGESGTQSRMVTTYRCASATCDSNTTMESRGCSRDTDGDGCGSVTYGSWTSCDYGSGCAESGTRSRPRYTPTCSGGTCSTVTTTQNGSCSRSTDGNSCGTTMTGPWGSCQYEGGRCDETGQRERTTTVYTCLGGSCTTDELTQTDPCSRNTDGLACIGFSNPCANYFCSSGSCQTFDACSGLERCCGEPQGCTTDPCF